MPRMLSCAIWCGHRQVRPLGSRTATNAAERRIITQAAFGSAACAKCHTISGTPGKGRFGPDLTRHEPRHHCCGAATTRLELRLWIKNPDAVKPGSKMPAMGLTDQDVDAVAAYLETAR